ncbi:MAG: hypothetical protein Q8M40_11250, partial [Legionella sp.]|nr:hypothetical protein [Legionella sp.]
PALRAKQCPLQCVNNIKNKDQRKILELLYENFDEMAEYGWNKLENKSYQSLASQFKKRFINNKNTNQPSQLPLTGVSFPVTAYANSQQPENQDYVHYQQELLHTNIDNYILCSQEPTPCSSNEFTDPNYYTDIPYYNNEACQDIYYSYNSATLIQSSEISYGQNDSVYSYGQGYQNPVINSSKVNFQFDDNNFNLIPLDNGISSPEYGNLTHNRFISTNFSDEAPYIQQFVAQPQEQLPINSQANWGFIRNDETQNPHQSPEPVNTIVFQVPSEIDLPVINSSITLTKYHFFTSRDRNVNSQQNPSEKELFNSPETFPPKH